MEKELIFAISSFEWTEEWKKKQQTNKFMGTCVPIKRQKLHFFSLKQKTENIWNMQHILFTHALHVVNSINSLFFENSFAILLLFKVKSDCNCYWKLDYNHIRFIVRAPK